MAAIPANPMLFWNETKNRRNASKSIILLKKIITQTDSDYRQEAETLLHIAEDYIGIKEKRHRQSRKAHTKTDAKAQGESIAGREIDEVKNIIFSLSWNWKK